MQTAEESFCREIEELTRRYEKDGAALLERHRERVEMAKREYEDAQQSVYRDAREYNASYEALVDDAARRCAERSEHPEDIWSAASIVKLLMGGVANDVITVGDPGNARAKIAYEQKRRAEAEASQPKSDYVIGFGIDGSPMRIGVGDA